MSLLFPDMNVRDVAANRPAAGIEGRMFFASDTGEQSRDNGVTWDDVTPGVHTFGAKLTATNPTVYFPRTPFAGIIKAWSMVSVSGSPITAAVKVWKSASALPTGADSINTSGVGLSAAAETRSTTLTDFTDTTISVGDRVAIHLESGTDPVMFILEYA